MEMISLTPGGDTGQATVRFAASDPFFVGHFPEAPVLPGVVLIDTAVQLVARSLNRPLRLDRLANVKFCNAVLPEQEIRFTFTVVWEEAPSARVKVNGRWFRGADRVAEFVFTAVPFAEEGGAA